MSYRQEIVGGIFFLLARSVYRQTKSDEQIEKVKQYRAQAEAP